MSVCRDELGPVVRGRSSSANEASKPIMMLNRRQTHVGGNVPLCFSPVNGESAVLRVGFAVVNVVLVCLLVGCLISSGLQLVD